MSLPIEILELLEDPRFSTIHVGQLLELIDGKPSHRNIKVKDLLDHIKWLQQELKGRDDAILECINGATSYSGDAMIRGDAFAALYAIARRIRYNRK